MERVFGEKIKRLRKEKFSEEELFRRIATGNMSIGTTLALSGDGEIDKVKNSETLASSIRKIGSECIEYQATYSKVKRNMRAATIAFTGAAIFIEGAILNEPGISAIGMASMYAGLAFKESFTEDFDKQHEELEIRLLSLSLPQGYVDKHFLSIVNTLAAKVRPAKEEKERVDKIDKREGAIRKSKIELGLNDKSEQVGLDELLQKDARIGK